MCVTVLRNIPEDCVVPNLFCMEFCIVKRGVIVYLLFFFCLDTLPLIIAQIVFIFIFPIIILRSSVWGDIR